MLEPNAAIPEQPLLTMDVLVAEDNPTNRLVVGKTAQQLGRQRALRRERDRGERTLCERPPGLDLVLMDCEMPEMDGYTATQHIRSTRSHQTGSTTPIIALTAHVLPEFRQACGGRRHVRLRDQTCRPADSAGGYSQGDSTESNTGFRLIVTCRRRSPAQ